MYISAPGGGNPTRSRNRIVQFLSCTSTGVAETATKVKYIRRFILYCVRFGFETTHIFGNKVQPELVQAHNQFKVLFAHRNPDEIIAEARCEAYYEDRKDRLTGRISNTKTTPLAKCSSRSRHLQVATATGRSLFVISSSCWVMIFSLVTCISP
jgi:hypothetical protein